jgi:hypothetical protein
MLQVIDSQNSSQNPYLVPVIISLIQKGQTRKRLETDGSNEKANEPISFSVYKVKEREIGKKEQLDSIDSSILEETLFSSSYKYRRDLTKRIEVDCGTYIIVPSLYYKDTETDYILRIILRDDRSKKHINIFDLNKFEIECKNKFASTYSEEVRFHYNTHAHSFRVSSKTCSIL